MKKYLNTKAISLILSLLIIMSFNTGFSHADKNIIYDNPENLIEKLSHPRLGEGMADGILPAEGDRANSYSWALAELGDYVYIGSNRNILTETLLDMVEMKLGDESKDLVLKILKDLSDDTIPTDRDDVADSEGRIFRYNLKEKEFEEIHKSSGIDSGYRSAVTFTPKDESESSVYFGAIGEKSRVIRLDKDFKKNDEPKAVFEAETGQSSVRAMAIHEDSLCIGVLTTDGLLPGESKEDMGNLEIKQSTNPEKNNWNTIASLEDFKDFEECNPRTDLMSVGQSGIWDMISFNGSIYAFIGTGYDPNSDENGHSVFKGTYLPEDSSANNAGWLWEMIVGPMEDEKGELTGAKYPRGMGNQYDGSASPFLYTNPEGETHVYVGTFDSIFDSLFNIALDKSYKSLYKAMHPAKVYRFDKDDNWEMVVGNPDEHFNNKIGNYYAGFSDDVESSVHSPNFYMWRMAEYKGELFVGTLNPTPLLDVVVPPFIIDLEEYTKEDLMTLIKLFGSVWPEKVVEDFDEAVIKEEAASDAVLEADELYRQSVKVEEAGKGASDAIDAIEKEIPELKRKSSLDDTKFISSLIAMSSLTDEVKDQIEEPKAEPEPEPEPELEEKPEAEEKLEEELEEEPEEESKPELEEKIVNIESLSKLIDELNKETKRFKDLARKNTDSNIDIKRNLMRGEITARERASRTANAADRASNLTTELVEELAKISKDNEVEVMPNQEFINLITEAIDAIKAAYEEAQEFKNLADEELADAKEEAYKAEEATSRAKEFFIKVNNELSKLIEDITVDEYKNISNIIDKIIELDLGYGKDELENLRYIIELRVMINTNIEADNMGCSVYRSKDGINFTPVTTNGFNDKYNYGLRTFLPTEEGLFMGMANPFYGTQLWRLGDLEGETDPIEPVDPTDPTDSGTSSGSSSSRTSRDRSETDSRDREVITEIELDPIPLGELKAKLERKDHFAYVVGYEDGNIKPLKNTTREEVAMIFYKLLTDESRKAFSSDNNPFNDVDNSKWSNQAISTLYKAGILEGYEDESFRPSDSITRAEIVTMAAKFDELKESDTNKFSDTMGHWAEKYINHSASKGWVSGYKDATFKPDQEIIRAEVMELTNNVVGRKVMKENIHPDARIWPDNPSDAWYYEAIMEASNSHDYIYKSGNELWTGIKDDKVWP